MVRLRKRGGGATVLGYTWATDGAIVEVAEEHARELLRIPDGDYEVVPDDTFSEVVDEDYPPPVSGNRTTTQRRPPPKRRMINE